MSEKEKDILEGELRNLVDKLDRTFIRKTQIEVHQCSIKCCQREDYPLKSVQMCIDNCNAPLQRTQTIINTELGQFHERLHRCMDECKDSVHDSVSGRPSQAETARMERDFNSCQIKCFEKMRENIPKVFNKIALALNDKTSVG